MAECVDLCRWCWFEADCCSFSSSWALVARLPLPRSRCTGCPMKARWSITSSNFVSRISFLPGMRELASKLCSMPRKWVYSAPSPRWAAKPGPWVGDSSSRPSLELEQLESTESPRLRYLALEGVEDCACPAVEEPLLEACDPCSSQSWDWSLV